MNPRCALVILVAAACVLGGCGSQWVGDGLHEVDGITMLAERPCQTDGWCDVERSTAVAALNLADDDVVRVLTASPPTSWRDWQGHVTIGTHAGLYRPRVVVLELRDSSRRAVVLLCGQIGNHPRDCFPTQPWTRPPG